MAVPQGKIEVSFTTGPLDTPVWVDISAYVTDAGFATKRGRSSEFDTVQAGTATITLDNRARRFDPSYVGSPYAGYLVPGKQIRMQGTWISTDYAVLRGIVQSWQYQEQEINGVIVVSITDVVGAYFARVQLGDEEIITTSWTGVSYPSGVNWATGMGTQPGNRKLTFAMSTLASGQSVGIRIEGIDGGGFSRTETLTLTYPTLIASSFYAYRTVSLIGESSFTGAVLTKLYTVSIGPTFPTQTISFTFAALLYAAQWTQTTINSTASGHQAFSPSSSLLAALNALIETESGAWFISRDGTAVVQGRYYPINQTATLALVNVAGTGGGLPEVQFTGLTFDSGDRYLYNEVKLQANGGNPQVARDSASQAAYFLRTYSKSGLLTTTDAEVLSAAQWRLGFYRQPVVRITQVVCRGDLSATPAWAALLQAELRQRVTVVWTPPDGTTALTQDSLIEGISITARRGVWTVTLSLSPRVILRTYLKMDDAVYGRVDLNAVIY